MVRFVQYLTNFVIFIILIALSIKIIELPHLSINESNLLVSFSESIGIKDAELTYTLLFFLTHSLIALALFLTGRCVVRKIYQKKPKRNSLPR